MKKLLLLFLGIFLSLNMMAQLEVKEGSFKEVEGFVNINTEMMFDDNDKPYAVLKVKTENINDKERRKLLFQGDARTFIECEYKVGEVWLYISYYATYLKISHPDFSSTEFWFPFDMQGKKGYELTLFNKPSLEEDFMKRLEAFENATEAGLNTGEYGYVVIKTTPVNEATVLIDGEEMEMKTPFVSDKLGIGHHRIRVIKDNYKPYVTVVEIEEGKTINLDVVLDQAFGNLEIVTQPENVGIRLNRIEKGKTPKTFNNIPTGNYKIELNKNKYQAISKDVVVKDGETTYVDVEMEKMKSLRKKGWVLRPEIGCGFFEDDNGRHRVDIHYANDAYYTAYENSTYFLLNANIGYQFNSFIYCGCVLGIELMATKMMSMPLYINPRFYVNDGRTSLYFDVKFGYAFNMKSSEIIKRKSDFYPYTIDKVSNSSVRFEGLIGALEIGVEYKNFSFGISAGIHRLYSEVELNIIDVSSHDINYPGYVMFKYGYSIFLNKK